MPKSWSETSWRHQGKKLLTEYFEVQQFARPVPYSVRHYCENPCLPQPLTPFLSHTPRPICVSSLVFCQAPSPCGRETTPRALTLPPNPELLDTHTGGEPNRQDTQERVENAVFSSRLAPKQPAKKGRYHEHLQSKTPTNKHARQTIPHYWYSWLFFCFVSMAT